MMWNEREKDRQTHTHTETVRKRERENMIINYCLSLEMKDDCQLPGTGVSPLAKGVVQTPLYPL